MQYRSGVAILTALMAGRVMTLWFVGQAGNAPAGSPPDAWLMPLLGDAAVGLAALPIAYLAWRRTGLGVWTSVLVFHAIGLWDTASAYIISRSNPWPEFFMIELLGAGMFFGAAALHVIALVIVGRRRDLWLIVDGAV